MRIHFRLDPYLEGFGHKPSGVLTALVGKAEVGELAFYNDQEYGLLMLEYLIVEPDWRGKGIGKALHQKLRTLVQRRWPWVKYATGDVTSLGALRLLLQVYGEPLYLADSVRRYTLAEAAQILPPVGETDKYGHIETHGRYLAVNVWLGRGPVPADQPWKEE